LVRRKSSNFLEIRSKLATKSVSRQRAESPWFQNPKPLMGGSRLTSLLRWRRN